MTNDPIESEQEGQITPDQTPDRNPHADPADHGATPPLATPVGVEPPAAASPPPPEERPPAEPPAKPAGVASLRIQIGSLRDRVVTDATQGKPVVADAPATSDQPASASQPPVTSDSGPQAGSTDTAGPVVQPPPVDIPTNVPRPNRRDSMSGELEQEVAAALGNMSLNELIEQSASAGSSTTGEGDIEPQSAVDGRIVSIGRDEVFFDLGGRNQGVAPISQFETPPEVGMTMKLTVHRYDSDDGLYEVALPGAAVAVGDWSQVSEGLIVEAMVTGHNKGGLECHVGALRGFMPISQVSLYRVDDATEFVGQKLACVVTEANPRRRNLVLSHRAVLEREQAEARERLWNELAVGQIHEGVVRSLKDFGAFVDLGGVDGMIHVSQLSWDRIGHPSEVLEVGQQVRVKIEKLNRDAQRVGLAYRDLMENPWSHAADKYPVSTRVKGTVTKIMDFGALVRLEPGIAGMVHISELSHTRIWRVSDAVQEGEEVEVQVLSVDPTAQRISLSLKALQAAPQRTSEKKQDDHLPLEGRKVPKPRREDLKGGINQGAGGERFGLKW